MYSALNILTHFYISKGIYTLLLLVSKIVERLQCILKRYFRDVIYLFAAKDFESFIRKLSILSKDAYSGGWGGSCYLRHCDAFRMKIDI